MWLEREIQLGVQLENDFPNYDLAPWARSSSPGSLSSALSTTHATTDLPVKEFIDLMDGSTHWDFKSLETLRNLNLVQSRLILAVLFTFLTFPIKKSLLIPMVYVEAPSSSW